MITNPYDHPLDASERHTVRVQTNCDANDVNLIRNTTAYKGTVTNIIAHQIYNLANELRSLGILGYNPAATAILTVLTRPRALSTDDVRDLAVAIAPDDRPAWLQRRIDDGQVPVATKGTPKKSSGDSHSPRKRVKSNKTSKQA